MGHLHKTMAVVFILISFFTGACGNRSAGETGSNAKEFITEILAEAHDNGVNVEVNNISLSDMQMSVVMTYYYDDGKEANDMDIFPQCIINGMPMDADYSASGKTFNSDNTKIQQTFYINYGDAIPDKNNLVEINADVCRTQTGEIEDIAQISISLNDVVCKDAVSDSEGISFKTTDGGIITELQLKHTGTEYVLCFAADEKYNNGLYYFTGTDNVGREYIFTGITEGNGSQIGLRCYMLSDGEISEMTELPEDCEYINVVMRKGELDGENTDSENQISDSIKIFLN